VGILQFFPASSFPADVLKRQHRLPDLIAGNGSAARVRVPEFAPARNLLCYNFSIRDNWKTQTMRALEGVPRNMSSTKSNLRLIGAFAALATLALAISCRGFFVNPTISSLAVGPVNPTIETGTTNNTVQMTAFGTNSDGSTNSNPSVAWSINPSSGVASISSTGLVTSVAVGTATVTATSNQIPTVSGTQNLTVTVGCINQITLNPTSGSISASGTNTSVNITATASTCNGPQPVTDVATWTSNNTSLATVAAGVVTAVPGITTSGQVQITASIGNIFSSPATINVSP
jgi:hypothetical protein